jgi:hypothetical protein
MLDSAFRVPGTRFRFGFDGLMGLIPGLGDFVGAIFGAYGVLVARQMGAPLALQARMLANVGLDAAVGAIPLAGDLFDFAFKPHLRNLALLDRWRADPARTVRRTRLMLVVVPLAIVLMAVVTLVLAILGLIALTLFLWSRRLGREPRNERGTIIGLRQARKCHRIARHERGRALQPFVERRCIPGEVRLPERRRISEARHGSGLAAHQAREIRAEHRGCPGFQLVAGLTLRKQQFAALQLRLGRGCARGQRVGREDDGQGRDGQQHAQHQRSSGRQDCREFYRPCLNGTLRETTVLRG